MIDHRLEAWPSVMLTGHRKLAADDRIWVAEQLDVVAARLQLNHGTETAISGMALESDTMWAETVLDHGMQLTVAIPFPSQSCDPTAPPHARWTAEQQATWASLVAQAGTVVMVSERDPADHKERVRMLHARNDAMLDLADAVVGVWDEGNLRSGTSSCLRKAAGAGLPIILLNLKRRGLPRRPSPDWWAQALRMPARRTS